MTRNRLKAAPLPLRIAFAKTQGIIVMPVALQMINHK